MTTTAANPFQRAALDAIRAALSRGELAEAERQCERMLEKSPANVEALNYWAMIAVRQQRPQLALQRLEQALAAQPNDPLSLNNLGQVKRTQGDLEGALEAFTRLTELNPQDFPARLHRGLMLEALGRSHDALIAYARAVRDARLQGRWLSDETTAPSLREPVKHAMHVVNQGTQTLFAASYEPLKVQYGAAALGRVERALAMHLGLILPETPDPRQAPTFFHFPGLPSAPYLPRALFSWIPELEAKTAAIREELVALLPSASGREQVFHNNAMAEENLKGLHGAPAWNGYYFYRHGEPHAANRAACPATAAALDALPLARVRAHAPEALFSVFAPGTHLLKHRGVTNTRLVGHLPLLVPPDCALSVADIPHVWREGEVVVFDDTYEHEAWNRSRETRVVLIFDLWNPYLTEVECAAVAELVATIGDFRAATEA